MDSATAVLILGIVKLAQDLTPEAVSLIHSFADKLQGKTPGEIAAIAHAINAGTIAEIDAELGQPGLRDVSAPQSAAFKKLG